MRKSGILRNILRGLLTIAVITNNVVVYAAIPQTLISVPYYDIKPVKPENHEYFTVNEFFVQYFPYSQIRPTTNSGQLRENIQTGFVLRTFDKFFNGDYFRKTTIGRVAHEVQDATSQTITVATAPSGIEHKVGFDFRVLDKNATVRYDGYLHSDVAYNFETKLIYLTVSKALSSVTTLALTNTSEVGTITPGGNLSITYNF